jgi:hypothetical protein
MVKKKSRKRWSASTHGFAVYPSPGKFPRALLPGEVIGFIAWAQR